MEHARKRTHSRNLLVASLRRGCNAVRRGCRLHEAPPPPLQPVPAAHLLAVLLLDPGSDVQSPRVDREDHGTEHEEAVDGTAREDVEEVGLRDAVAANEARPEDTP